MQTDQNIVYYEKQKLDVKKWILIPMFIALGMLVLLMAVPLLYFYFTGGVAAINETFNAPFIVVTVIGALIPCCILYLVRTRMKLELFVTKSGLSYKYLLLSVKERSFSWNDVESIQVKKYPYAATRPGEQNKIYTKGQDVFVMTADMMGVEIKMKDGKYKFFTLNNSDEFMKSVKRLELNLQLINK